MSSPEVQITIHPEPTLFQRLKAHIDAQVRANPATRTSIALNYLSRTLSVVDDSVIRDIKSRLANTDYSVAPACALAIGLTIDRMWLLNAALGGFAWLNDTTYEEAKNKDFVRRSSVVLLGVHAVKLVVDIATISPLSFAFDVATMVKHVQILRRPKLSAKES